MLIEAFNGLTKIKSTPIPFPIRQLCSLLTVIYVYSAPLALATAFRNYDLYWNILGRTVGGSVLLAIAFFGINQTAADLEVTQHIRTRARPALGCPRSSPPPPFPGRWPLLRWA